MMSQSEPKKKKDKKKKKDWIWVMEKIFSCDDAQNFTMHRDIFTMTISEWRRSII